MSVWKVFIPHELLYKESGYVVGNVWKELCLICVSGVVPSARLPSDKKHWSDEQLSSKLIGSWNIPEIKLTLESKLVFNSVCRKDIWIFLEYSMSSLVAKIAGAHVVCVIFNPEELWMSYFIQGATSVQSGVYTHRFSSSHIDNMIAAISDAKGSSLVTHFMENATRVKRSQWLIDFFLWMPLKFFTFLSYIYNRSIQIKFVKGFVTPAFTHQFGLKCMQVKYVTEHQKSSSEQLRFLNMSTKQYFDSLLGLSLIVFLAFKIISTAAIAECVMTWAENVANLLKTLLHWMMGSPVGLKLNHHLNQFLGKFFMYHIYLWTRYLALIRPVLDSVLWYTSLVGVFGFSFQLCLLQDIFSIMTFHIYCFYVYAARLYSLQILALSSLWRLFRGKKWNVLRQRVDSASYDVDQLFLGTLLFTILLFLLPTTALYYVVFTSLRLLILLIQSMLSKLVATINSLPLYTLLLWVLRSMSVAGNIVFRVWPTDDTNTTLILTMQIVQLPLTKLLAFCCYNNIKETEKDYSWKMFTKNIISGQLVYPWIESTEKN